MTEAPERSRERCARVRCTHHGRAFNEPRHDLANRRRRRGIRGAFSLV